MNRADFYIMDHDKSMRWVGSLAKYGDPFEIPLEILVEANEVVFEERVHEFLYDHVHGLPFDYGTKWPWEWPDSRMTDYTYIFHICTGKVYVSHSGGRLMDPLKLVQGMDEIGADIGMGTIEFPTMLHKNLEESEKIIRLAKEHGFKSAEVV